MIVAALTSSQSLGLAAVAFGSLLVCGVFIALRGSRTLKDLKVKLSERMGQGQWDFSASFATNITIVASVLTIILTTSNALPSDTHIFPTNAYAGLAIFFGVLVAVAPLLYNGTVIRVNVAPDQVDTAAEYHGTVWGFLLAATVTAWGVLGSAVTAFVLFLELEEQGSLSVPLVALLGVALGVAVAFCARYLWVRVDGTIVNEFDEKIRGARLRRSEVTRAAGPNSLSAPTENNPPPSPRWTLL